MLKSSRLMHFARKPEKLSGSVAEIVNLRQFRKKQLRAEKEAIAADNRRSFGLSTKIRHASKVENQRQNRHLDGHERTCSREADSD